MSRSWYVRCKQETLGPLSADELAAEVSAGRISWIDLAARSGDARWSLLEEFDWLKEAVARVTENRSCDEAVWLIRKNSHDLAQGPLTRKAISDGLKSGAISFSDFAWRSRASGSVSGGDAGPTGSWQRIGDCAELNGHDFARSSPALAERGEPPLEFQVPVLAAAQVDGAELLRNVLRAQGASGRDFVKPPEADGDDLVAERLPDWMRVIGVLALCLAAFPARAVSELEITPLKLSSSQPALVFQSDVGLDEAIDIHIQGRSGEIVDQLSYDKGLRLMRKPGEVLALELAPLKMPRGHYTVDAAAGALKKSVSIFIGNHDAQFDLELKAHAKRIAAAQQAEKKAIYYTARKMEALANQFDQRLKRNLAKQDKAAKLTSARDFKNWTRLVSKSKSRLLPIARSCLQSCAYPKDVRGLIETIEKMEEDARHLTELGGQGRQTASASSSDLQSEFRQFRKNAASLTSQPE